MNRKTDQFFNVPIKKVQTTLGNLDLPILYYDYGYAHFLFWADYNRVMPELKGTIFTPCRFFNGKAGVLLNFFEYRDTAVGPYNEVGLSILCYPKKLKKGGPFVTQLFKDAKDWKMGAYVVDLPVTTEIAYVGGREIWSYPKFVTNIIIDLSGRRFNGVVDDPVLKEPIFTLKGTMGIFGTGSRMRQASFISHSVHKGKALRTLTEVDATSKANLGFSGNLVVNDRSTHKMAQHLAQMGLRNKKPFALMSCENARMILHEGVPID